MPGNGRGRLSRSVPSKCEAGFDLLCQYNAAVY